ncbi:hypothetical protein M427DRAFT_64286 [Gonapodya prolifera JEL478]|uniref:SnoaL-like domain-containing protein n=1 Tax=Gonapodya prolifera (strain JEL478) TaxID=1344416 RepID=A0A138ZY20_GONPJ|nr:hypothetical protein M427DRAFT_64286 [Gonapodya prolifera JEL478]|eukprot:KXS09389.1 hypothetical protein M427DRAFT_64286 [Gonapodya prolifera JEL478]
MSSDQILALAEKFVGAIARGDVPTVRECYAPDAKIWHNTDLIFQTVDENIVTLLNLVKTTTSREYTDRVVSTFQRKDGTRGFIQEHVLVAKSLSGPTLRLPACVICTVNSDATRITQLREYMDQVTIDKYSSLIVATRKELKKAGKL